MLKIPRFLILAVSTLTFMLTGPATAQTDWPKNAIKIILPAGPGGTSDILMRLMTEPLGRLLGQPIVVENRAGAGGTIAATLAAQAEPDGYTLMMSSTATHAIGPSMYKLKFDMDKNVTAIAHVAFMPNILYVRKGSPLKNVRDIMAYARANPGKLNYASSGQGTTTHLAAVAFSQATGIDLVHIPYNGAAPATQAVLSGDAALAFENLAPIMGQIRGGTVVPIAVTVPKRSEQLPEIPTMIESGLPGFNITTWFGIVAPGGTPKPIVDKVAAAFETVLKDPKVQEQIRKLGSEPQFMGPREFELYMKSERLNWAVIVKGAGVTVN